MKLLIILLLLLSSWTAAVDAAAPVGTCTPSVSSGVAPLAVIFDCSAITDADTTTPFTSLLYWTTFGDPGAGVWANGAIVNAPKNRAVGPIVGHIFETAKATPYIVTTYVSDGVNILKITNSITVTDPNTVYAGTATVCFTNGSDFTGCPAGATQTGSTSDWDAAIASCIGTTKRCLFRRGDTFAASAHGTISAAGPNTVGAYGSGALPICNAATAKACILLTTGVTDTRIMDLDLVGTSVDDPTGFEAGVKTTAAVSGVTILRVTAREMGASGIMLSDGSVTNSIVQESTAYNNYGGNAAGGNYYTSALLGNIFGPVGGGSGEHAFRGQVMQKTVLAHNTTQGPATSKTSMSIRALTHATDADDTKLFVINANKITTGTLSVSLLALEPNNTTSDGRIFDGLVFGNWVVAGAFPSAGTVIGIEVNAVRITVRNNLIDLSAPTSAGRYGVLIARIGVEPMPDANNLYNNTFYSSATATTYGVGIAAGVTNTTGKNNLCRFDNGTACIIDAGTGTSWDATNSDTGETTGTDPLFDGPTTTPIGFRPSTASYAATGGTAIFPASNDDFYGCDDITANEHIGAFVPRLRARCRGAAGP